MSFDAASVMLKDPAPEFTQQLAATARAAYIEKSSAQGRAMIVCAAFDSLAGIGCIDAPFTAWAEMIATEDGFPLRRVGRRAPTYPALIWNVASLAEAAPSLRWAPLFAALAAASPDTGLDRVGGAVLAGERVADVAAGLLSRQATAYPTVGTLAAATAASLAGPSEGGDLVDVLDLAASLMVLAPDWSRAGSGRRAGHAAASGWLAAVLPSHLITPMSGAVVHTLSAAAGCPNEVDAASTTVGELLEYF